MSACRSSWTACRPDIGFLRSGVPLPGLCKSPCVWKPYDSVLHGLTFAVLGTSAFILAETQLQTLHVMQGPIGSSFPALLPPLPLRSNLCF